MLPETIAAAIALMCSFEHPGYTKESKWNCAEVVLNCAMEANGKWTESKNKLDECISKGHEQFRRIK